MKIADNYVSHPKFIADRNHKREFKDMLVEKTSPQKPERADSITVTRPEITIESTKDVEASGQNPEVVTTVETNAVQAIKANLPKISSKDSTDVKLAKLREIAANMDYTGMTATQVYKDIYDRYNDAFDGNLAAITTFQLSEEWLGINQQFIKEIDHTPELLDTGERYSRKEALGYGAMSYDEIEAAIVEKYAGKNTLLDFLNMTGELYRTGVLTNKSDWENAISLVSNFESELLHVYHCEQIQKGVNPSSDLFNWLLPTARLQIMLGERFDPVAFSRDMVQNTVYTWSDGSEDTEHKFKVAELIDDFIAMLEKHWEKMRDTDSQPDKSVESKAGQSTESKDTDKDSGDNLLPPVAQVISKLGESQSDNEERTKTNEEENI